METSGRVRSSALVAFGVAGLGAALLGGWFYAVYNGTVYWNLNNDHRWYYVHPALYAATAAAAVIAIVAGARGVRLAVRPLFAWFPWLLALLVLLTLWACASSAMARVCLV